MVVIDFFLLILVRDFLLESIKTYHLNLHFENNCACCIFSTMQLIPVQFLTDIVATTSFIN